MRNLQNALFEMFDRVLNTTLLVAQPNKVSVVAQPNKASVGLFSITVFEVMDMEKLDMDFFKTRKKL